MKETFDSVLRGAIRLSQPAQGYRVNVDSLLLCDFVGAAPLGRVLDLGTGSGVIALVLAQRDPEARVDAIELQEPMAALAARNVAMNNLAGRVLVHRADLRALRASGLALAAYDLVVSNPPYQALATGPAPPLAEKALATHEVECTLADVVRAAAEHVVPGGRVCLVYPAERAGELIAALEGARLRVTRLRVVYGRAGEPARRVLVEAERNGRAQLVIAPPLWLYDEAGAKTAEHARIVGE
ncbi:MAG: methyltransferase [Deltaproteobacteria bacterium]|nr:methyltransferase [Deltaproteobacteria bacterium]